MNQICKTKSKYYLLMREDNNNHKETKQKNQEILLKSYKKVKNSNKQIK